MLKQRLAARARFLHRRKLPNFISSAAAATVALTNMATENELTIIHSYASLATGVGIIRANWNPDTRQLDSDVSARKKVSSHIFFWVCLFWTIYGILRLHSEFTQHQSSSRFDFLVQALYIVVTVLNLAELDVIVGYALSNRELIFLFNQLLTFNKQIGTSARSLHREKIFRLIMYLFVPSSFGTIFALALAEFYYVHLHTGSTIAALIASASYFTLTSCGNLLFGFLQMYIFLYFTVVNGTLSKYQELSRMSNMAFVDVGLIKEIIRNYRSLTILCDSFNRSYSRVIAIGLKYILSMVFMMCMVVAVRSNHFPLVSVAFLAPAIYLYLILSLAAQMTSSLWQMSCQFIWSMKHSSPALTTAAGHHHHSPEYVRRVLKSLQPLRFGVGGLYYMEKSAKLTLAAILLDGTANLLITFKSDHLK